MTAQTVSTAVANREAGIVNVMWTRKAHFKAVLPEHVEVRSFLGTAAAALYASDDLMKAATRNPDSLIAALMRCAALGHQPGTEEFYLTPRKGSVLGIEGYRGIVERMYRSGAVKSVIVREVCAKDKFKYVEGEMDRPQHAIGGGDPYNSNSTGADFFGPQGSRDRGQMVGVYAYAILTTGAVSRVVILTRDDVMAAREASDAKDSSYSPWNRMDGGQAHPEFQGRSMWWKTAARRLEPWVPTSAEYRREQLRAAAAASESAGRPPASANGNGHAAADTEIHDAVIVDGTPDVPSATVTPPGGAEGTQGPRPVPPGQPAADEAATGRGPARASTGQVGIIASHFARLGFGDDEREQRLAATAIIAGTESITSTKDLDEVQARAVMDTLSRCKDRDALIVLLAAGDKPSDG